MSIHNDPAVTLGFVACESLDLCNSLYQTLATASGTVAGFVASEPNPQRRMVLNQIANDIQANMVSWGNQLATLALAAEQAVKDVEMDEIARKYTDRACGGGR
jgi:hypothetical protein